jgi:hypothetical protein
MPRRLPFHGGLNGYCDTGAGLEARRRGYGPKLKPFLAMALSQVR